MAKLKTINKKQEVDIVSIRFKPEDIKNVRKLADKYADGNLSEWIRYAALNFKPSKKDLV